MDNSVYVSGFEQISALGIGKEALLTKSAYDVWKNFYPYAPVGQDFDFHKITGLKESSATRQMDTLAKYTIACTHLLISAQKNFMNPERSGVILGSAFGCTASNHSFLQTLISQGPRMTAPVVFRNTVSNAVAGHMAITFQVVGPNSVINSGMVSGLQALAYAYDQIIDGHCEHILTGTSDWVSELILKRFELKGDKGQKRKLPLMDGACVFLLQANQNNLKSGWHLLGYTMGFLQKENKENGVVRNIEKILQKTNLDFSDIDCIIFHTDCTTIYHCSADSSIEMCSQLLKQINILPLQENTSIPAMLSLAAALMELPKGKEPVFFHKTIDNPQKTIKKHMLFIAIGYDGNIAALLLRFNKVDER